MNPYVDRIFTVILFCILVSFLLGNVSGMMIHHYFIAPKEDLIK